MGLGIQPHKEYFAIYALIYVWKQFFQLLNWHKIFTYIIILTFFLQNGYQFDYKLAPLWHHMSSYWKTAVTISPNMKVTGQKSQFPNFLVNLEKFGNAKSRLLKNPHSTSFMNWDQHFKLQMLNLWTSWENLYPYLSFAAWNKMGNSHKRGRLHFKLNTNDWDIPFPKILRICQWIGKNIFHWEKWSEPIKLIRECLRLKSKI